MRSITQLINAGNDESLDELVIIAYERLHVSAKQALGHTCDTPSVQATELVNELYLYFKNQDGVKCNDSAHFFAIAALKLRHILQDRYRKKKSKKRDFGVQVDTQALDERTSTPQLIESLIVNGHMETLERIDPQAARVVDLLVFWEFSISEVAEILDVSSRTIDRKWRWAIAWFSSRE